MVHLVEGAGRRPALGRRGPHAEGAGRGVHDVAQAVEVGGVGQDVQDVPGPPLLHGDRADPGVERAALEGGGHGVAELLTGHVVEVGLEHQGRLPRADRRRVRRAAR